MATTSIGNTRGSWLGGLGSNASSSANSTTTQANTLTAQHLAAASSGMTAQLQQYYMQLQGSGISGGSGTLGASLAEPWEQQIKDMKKEILEEVEEKFERLHNKLDKMNEILLSLVKIEVPIDAIKQALSQEVSGTEVV